MKKEKKKQRLWDTMVVGQWYTTKGLSFLSKLTISEIAGFMKKLRVIGLVKQRTTKMNGSYSYKCYEWMKTFEYEFRVIEKLINENKQLED